jgi:hypothetical protein
MSVAGVILKATAEFVGEVFAALMTSLERLFTPDPPRVRGPTLDSLGEPKPFVPLLPPAPTPRAPTPPAPTPHVPPRLKLELMVEVGPAVGVAPSLLIKVRGGPVLADSFKLVYVVTGSFMEKGRPYDLGDSGSLNEPPASFRVVCHLPRLVGAPDDWSLLRTIYQDAILPPRRGVQTYQFNCQVFLQDGNDVLGTPRTLGAALQTVTFSVSLDFNGMGYLDELEWVSRRADALALLLAILARCQVEKPTKSQKLKAWVEALLPPFNSSERRREINQRLVCQYSAGQTSGSQVSLQRQQEIIAGLSQTGDHVLQRDIALLAVNLVGFEPSNALGRYICGTIVRAFSGALYSLPRRDLEPAPPLAVVPPSPPVPAPVVTPVLAVPSAPTPAPPVVVSVSPPASPVIRTPFTLQVRPILERGLAKGVEVFAQGAEVGGDAVIRELHYGLVDVAVAAEQPWLIAQADINQVQEPFRVAMTWEGGKYDPYRWNQVGRVLFGQALPPAGGGRNVVAVGCLYVVHNSGAAPVQLDARSQPCGLSVGSSGYLKLRDLRLNIRKQAFRLALGFATLAGKGTTYPQDNILTAYINWIAGECIVASEKERTKQVLHEMLDQQKELMFKGTRALASWKRLATQFSKEADAALKQKLVVVLDRLIDGRKTLLPGTYDLYNHCLDAFGLGHLPRRG